MSVGILSKVNSYSNMYAGKSSWGESASKSSSGPSIENSEGFGSDMLRKLEYNRWKQEKKSSVVEQSVSYADQLKASRKKSKEISNEKKKLQYNFKKISSQIIRSKNSVSARKAVQAAKREIMRLKRLKGSGEYDEEELQLAIDHAKSMEKVAKKKAVHLEQEELVERAHKGFGAALEEIEENKEKDSDESSEDEELEDEAINKASEDQWLDVDEEYQPEYDYQYELEIAMEEYEDLMQEMSMDIANSTEEISQSASDSMSEMKDEFNQEMSDMMEDMGLTELAESLYAPDPNMSEEDLKMLKIKHRAKEMKEIAEADRDYLKGIMEHEKSKAMKAAAGAMTGGSAGANSGVLEFHEAPKITPMISMPGAVGAHMEAPMIEGGFSVSI